MAGFVKVGVLADFEDGVLNTRDVNGERVLIVNTAGKLRALSNVCPHVSLPLSAGYIEDNAIVCGFHGSVFDLDSGECTAGPAFEAIDVYAVRVEGDDVLVGRR